MSAWSGMGGCFLRVVEGVRPAARRPFWCSPHKRYSCPSDPPATPPPRLHTTEGITLPFKAVALITEHGRTRLDVTVKARRLAVLRCAALGGVGALPDTTALRGGLFAARSAPPLCPPLSLLPLTAPPTHSSTHPPTHLPDTCRSSPRSLSSCLPQTWWSWCPCPTRPRAPPSTCRQVCGACMAP